MRHSTNIKRSFRTKESVIKASHKIARFLAFYLPQFHPIPENNAWHGQGFTEWTNVVKAKPRFTGHLQPRLPGELGFYDLRLTETQVEQARLAQEHGIYGFVYHHYWFGGKRLLHKPLDNMLQTGKPDFPFCLSWANESWSRKWGPTYGSVAKDSRIGETLIEQTYSKEDYGNHMKWFKTVCKDKRYITVQGKPVFIIYRPSLLPNAIKATTTLRKAARKLGIDDLYLCMVESFPDDRHNPQDWGFDASIEFQPDNRRRKPFKLASKEADTEHLYQYEMVVQMSLDQEKPEYKKYPCILPSWDNTSRRPSGATIYINSAPEKYGEWVYRQLQLQKKNGDGENLIFVNSWNEWAEGSQLEPDEYFGRKYLEAHAKAIIRFTQKK